MGLALPEVARVPRVTPELARRAASEGGVGAENPYPDRTAAGGVGSGGAPDVPGSVVYVRGRGDPGQGDY